MPFKYEILEKITNLVIEAAKSLSAMEKARYTCTKYASMHTERTIDVHFLIEYLSTLYLEQNMHITVNVLLL